ncbi:MAG: nitrous oxide reductase family maturation protein NosD, partial [Thermodesulfobacteriota bacterium]
QNAIIEDNRLSDVLFGIYLKNSSGTLISNNVIVGKDLPIPVRGDGIRLWYSSDTKILNNTITGARDLVMWWSGDTLIKGNKVEKGRYGLHYMYSDNNVFEDNIFIENYVGGFLMYSNNIKFNYNIFASNQGPATGYGIGFKDLDDITSTKNLFIDNRVGIYMDNSPHSVDSWNTLEDNVIAFNDIGISFMPSIERNMIVSNSFIDNAEQIEIRGGGTLSGNNWYAERKGNYWSDYVGYDDNNDGIGEIPYKSESLFESLIDKYPNLRVFVFSPVAQAIELASDAFPVIKPEPKVTDNYPLMKFKMLKRYAENTEGFSYKLFIVSLFMILIPAFSYLIIRRT